MAEHWRFGIGSYQGLYNESVNIFNQDKRGKQMTKGVRRMLSIWQHGGGMDWHFPAGWEWLDESLTKSNNSTREYIRDKVDEENFDLDDLRRPVPEEVRKILGPVARVLLRHFISFPRAPTAFLTLCYILAIEDTWEIEDYHVGYRLDETNGIDLLLRAGCVTLTDNDLYN